MSEREGENGDSSEDTERVDVTSPLGPEIPAPETVCDEADATGVVVWHRKHLRVDDQLALKRAVERADVVCPLFIFDPAFYSDAGIACDARIRLLHEALASLDRLYATVPALTDVRSGPRSRERLAATTPLDPGTPADADAGVSTAPASLDGSESPGLSFGYGNPVELLERFANQGWSVLTMATPTSRYGQRRDDRVRDACGDAVTFLSGDGLVRGQEWSRTNWQDRVEEWLQNTQHRPAWDDHAVTRLTVETGVTPAALDDAFEVDPTKTAVPTGTHRAAATQLRSFVDRLPDYPGNISAPQDARDGTSGLSPYLNFGLLSVRQVHQYVTEHAPSCRGLTMFTDRLVWNMHYNQKLVDWPGWTDRAVNPVFEAFNSDRHDPDLVTAWQRGETGFPMVDAAMRCLRRTGWLNFRMRAMSASFFTHILHQPWWIGADWYHHHLIDSDVGINYTQWQSQAGLIGKPSQRVYNPRKQVRDQDPDGEWVTEWVPELAELPAQFLDRPERTPLAVQAECGVSIGEDYPRPVVEFEARREAFWSRYRQRQPEAARQLRRPAIARRASFSGGYDAASAIASEYGDVDDGPDTQLSLTEAADEPEASSDAEQTGEAKTGRVTGNTQTPAAGVEPDEEVPAQSDTGKEPTVPTGTGTQRGEPSPDDRAATGEHDGAAESDERRREEPCDGDDNSSQNGQPSGRDSEQTTIGGFDRSEE